MANYQGLYGSQHLLFHDLRVLLETMLSSFADPGEFAFEEVDEGVTKAFEIIAAALFDAEMGVYAGIACGSRQAFVFLVRNMLVCLVISVPLGQPEVYQVHRVRFLPQTQQEVLGLDVAMYIVLGMYELQTTDLPTILTQSTLPSDPPTTAPS